MKRFRFVAFTMTFLSSFLPICAQNYDVMWKKVEEFTNKDLPASAAKEARRIFNLASKKGNGGQMLKAALFEMCMEKDISEDCANAAIPRFEQMLQQEKKVPMKSLLHAILGQLYNELDDTIEDSAHAQAVSHFRLSLADAEILSKESALPYMPIIQKGDDSHYYNNDLLSIVTDFATAGFAHIRDNKLNTEQLLREARQQEIAIYHKQGRREAEFLSLLKSHDENEADSTFYKELIEKFGDLDLCVRAYAKLAETGNPKECWEWAQEGIKRYLKAKGVQELRNKIKQLSSPLLETAFTESALYPGMKDSIAISARNLTSGTLYFYSFPFASTQEAPTKEKELEKYAINPVLQVPFELRKGEPYETVKDTIVVQMPKSGRYLVRIVSGSEKSTLKDCRISHLRLLSFSQPDGKQRLWVTDANTGIPVEKARIDYANGEQHKKILKTQYTDANGLTTFIPQERSFAIYYASVGNDNALDGVRQYFNGVNHSEEAENAVTKLAIYTDRAIYRPGQKVRVGGFLFRQQGDETTVIANKNVKLQLYDANSKKVGDEQLIQTDQFGALSADFTLPASCLNGYFNIQSTNGSASFRVEQYKRPSFTVSFDEVKEGYKAGDEINLKGTVKTYAGFPLAQTKVNIVVTRTKSPWCWWMMENNEDLLLRDTIQTDENGTFSIPVKLSLPDYSANEPAWRPRFCQFTTAATVTDENGETEKNEYTLFAGDHAVMLSTEIPNRICKEQHPSLQVTQRNAAFTPVEGIGEYEILQNEKTVLSGTLTFNKPFDAKKLYALPSGEYTLKVVPRGSDDKAVVLNHRFVLFSVKDKRPVGSEPLQVFVSSNKFENGKPVQLLIGSPLKDAYISYDRYEGNNLVESKILHLSNNNLLENLTYRDDYGKGLSYLFVLVQNGKVYSQNIQIRKPEPDKKLQLRWTTFRNLLRPGQKEEWKLQVLKDNKPVKASMLATLYDSSLDKFARHNLSFGLSFNRNLPHYDYVSNNNSLLNLGIHVGQKYEKEPSWQFNSINEELFPLGHSIAFAFNGHLNGVDYCVQECKLESSAMNDKAALPMRSVRTKAAGTLARKADFATAPKQVSALRTNFSETAFFMPRLVTGDNGEAALAFTLPQSLTTWNFRALAHSEAVDYGSLDTTIIAQKDFMLQPNVPRFLRSGDHSQMAVSLRNASKINQKGTVKFMILDPATEQVLDTQTANFDVAADKTQTFSFPLNPTGDYPILLCRMMADGKDFSDGEQHYIPVLDNSQQVIESIPLTFTQPEHREVNLSSLFPANTSRRSNQRISVEYTANPAWSAIEALPTMIKPYDNNALSLACSFYALSLATVEAQAHPNIYALADKWKTTQSVDSVYLMLERNDDLKQIILNETPWVGAADDEANRCKNLAEMFDKETVSYKRQSYLDRLIDLQTDNGSWSWFRGMPGNLWMTVEVSEILARLQKMSPEVMTDNAQEALTRAMKYMDSEASKYVAEMMKAEKQTHKKMNIDIAMLRYLYICTLQGYQSTTTRSFLLDRLQKSATRYDMYAKSLAAKVLAATNKTKAAKLTLRSLLEHTVCTKELGRYFDTNRAPGFYHCYKIPTQVAALEAISQLTPNDTQTIMDMTRWLLQSKRTETWDNPVAVVEAVYFLFCKQPLLQQSNSMEMPMLTLNYDNRSEDLHAAGNAQATNTLGYFRSSEKVLGTPKTLVVDKKDHQLSFGAVYSQYTAPIEDVKPASAGITIVCKYSVQKDDDWQSFQPGATLKVGDKIHVRYEITADRDYDFVCLKAGRAACMEPVRPLSGYSWRDGSYREVEDASTQYFFQNLSKGKHVIEDDLWIDRKGTFTSGVPTVQCVYSPEFSGRSEALTLIVE